MGIFFIISILICILIIYVVIDNRIIRIRKQSIICRSGKKRINILQISDLHSKILRNADYIKINKLDYDVIAITGDAFCDDDTEYIAIKEIMQNIKNVKYVLYVDGNNGTKAYDKKEDRLTNFGDFLESIGIIVLKDSINIKGVTFTNYNAVTNTLLDKNRRGKFKIYDSLTSRMHESNNFDIGLTHYPLTKEVIDKLNRTDEFYVPDVILAGHYHGGQIRVPFYGALVIPKYDKKGLTIFPNQKLISGLYENGKVKQYISRGIGVSKRIKLLGFRLFNTPEIDHISIYY